jgi:hypothetical protein
LIVNVNERKIKGLPPPHEKEGKKFACLPNIQDAVQQNPGKGSYSAFPFILFFFETRTAHFESIPDAG